MNSASPSAAYLLRPQILERRARLEAAATRSASAAYVHDLLAEVDAALERIEKGTFGLCETCHDSIEADRLAADPMVRFCLDHLSRREQRLHEQDLELANQIQTRLLPKSDLVLERWETHYHYAPLGPVGGDYCEVTASQDGKSVFFAVGDVAGKGVAASLLMTHLSAILRSLLSLDLPLAELMVRANRLFCESTLAAHYATLVCGHATDDGAEICNAGHCPPLLLEGLEARRVGSAGLPLGLFCSVEFPVSRLRLAEGESLVLYSDGLTEAQDNDGRDFGEEGLLRSLRGQFGRCAQALAKVVMADWERFQAGCRAADDVTLLVVHRRSGGPE